jgi:hypothetical protein
MAIPERTQAVKCGIQGRPSLRCSTKEAFADPQLDPGLTRPASLALVVAQ